MHQFLNLIIFKNQIDSPSLSCEIKQDETLRIHYYSIRKGLHFLTKGKTLLTAKRIL